MKDYKRENPVVGAYSNLPLNESLLYQMFRFATLFYVSSLSIGDKCFLIFSFVKINIRSKSNNEQMR